MLITSPPHAGHHGRVRVIKCKVKVIKCNVRVIEGMVIRVIEGRVNEITEDIKVGSLRSGH